MSEKHYRGCDGLQYALKINRLSKQIETWRGGKTSFAKIELSKPLKPPRCDATARLCNAGSRDMCKCVTRSKKQ